MAVFGLCEGNDVGFGVVVEEVLEVEDSSVHASRVECVGYDGGVGIMQWCWCVFSGVCGYGCGYVGVYCRWVWGGDLCCGGLGLGF